MVTGRKNWMFVGNEGGGRTAAILYSEVQTWKEIGVDLRQYLADALIRLRQGGDPRELTPHVWKERYAEELVQDRACVLAKLRGEGPEAQEEAKAAPHGRGAVRLTGTSWILNPRWHSNKNPRSIPLLQQNLVDASDVHAMC